MNKASISFMELEEELLQNDEVRYEHEKLKSRYEIISQMIAVRNEQGITQNEPAKS